MVITFVGPSGKVGTLALALFWGLGPGGLAQRVLVLLRLLVRMRPLE
jgi:hypothetical protein